MQKKCSQNKPSALVLKKNSGPISVCVVIPPVYDFYFTRHRFSGLGGEIVKKLLLENGCDVQFLNFPVQSKKGARQPLPKRLDFLAPHIIENEVGKLSFFTRYQRFGPPTVECAMQVVQSAPDMVFISCFAFCYADSALEIAEHIHRLSPRVLIVIGGAGVSAYPGFFTRNPNVDFVVSGEAEVTIPAFLRVIKTGNNDFSRVPNLFFNFNGTVTGPLLKKQTDAKEIAFVLKKTGESKEAVYYTTSLSRGCPKACRFCSNFLCHGREFRVIPINAVKDALAFIDQISEEGGKTIHVNFEDDNLLLDPDYFLTILDSFKSKWPGARFSAENGMDYTMLTPDLLKKLIDKGMTQFNLSIASIHNDILESEKRKAWLDRYEEIVKILDRCKIPCITYYICGFQKDTKTSVVSTIAWLSAHPTRLGISLFYPVPGIPDYQDLNVFDTIPSCLCAGSSAFPWNGSLSTAELVTAFRLSRFVNLLKTKPVSEMEKAVIEKSCRNRRLYSVVKAGRHKIIVPVPNTDDEMVQLFFDSINDTSLFDTQFRNWY